MNGLNESGEISQPIAFARGGSESDAIAIAESCESSHSVNSSRA